MEFLVLGSVAQFTVILIICKMRRRWYKPHLLLSRFGRLAHPPFTRTSCYTNFVLKNVTITVEEDALRWARKEAAEKNTSVSKLVGRMLEDKMRQTDEYWAAYEMWKRIKPIPGLAANRLTREEANERRR